VIFIYIIFISLNKKQKIISDCGYYKMLMLSFGSVLTCCSYLFISRNNFINCSLYFIVKNIGISIILLYYYINIILANKLGIKMIKFGKEEIKINKYNSKAELNTFNLGNECSYNKNISYMNLNTITDNFRNNNIINNNVNNNDFNSKIDDTSLNSFCVETHKIYIINNTKKIIYRTIIIYIIYVVVLFFIFLKNILSYKNEISNLIQDDSQNWRFNCNFENSDLILNLLYSVIFTFIAFIGNAILKYDCIFVFIQYIIYSSIISAISSALIGVIA